MTRISQGEARRYRIRYRKIGRSAYLGHLDLVRHLPRIFRRAGLEMFYSVGFHPKPELTYGPALGLGIPSLGEMMDVSLTDDLRADELLDRLRPVSLPGVDILDVVVLGNNDRALGRVLGRADFAARLPEDADVAGALARLEAGAPLSIRRSSDKGLDRVVDVRVSLGAVATFEDEEARALLDWPTGPLLRFAVAVSQEGSARPVEVIRALFGEDIAERTELARLALWSLDAETQRQIDPMRLDLLRPVAPPVRTIIVDATDGAMAAAP